MSMDDEFELPLFPLSTVLFPDGVLPLQIFEPRYLDMVGDCLRNQTGFGVCVIAEGKEAGGTARVQPVGTLGQIVDFDQRDNGLLGITVSGIKRFRVLRTWVREDRLLMGWVRPLPDPEPLFLPPTHGALTEFLRAILNRAGDPWKSLPERFDDVHWVTGRLMELLPLPLEQRYEALENDSAQDRLELLIDVLGSWPEALQR